MALLINQQPPSLNGIQLQFMLLLIAGLSFQSVYAQCAICPDGSPITRPDKKVIVLGFGDEIECSVAETLVPVVVGTDTNECQVIHSISTLCGCPIPENACHLCGDTETSVMVSEVDVDTRLLPDYSYLFNDPPSCELMEAYLHSIPANDPYCSAVQQDIAMECGCPASEHEFNKSATNFTNTNGTNTTFDPPSLTLRGIAFGTFGEGNAQDEANRRIVGRLSASLSVFGALLVVADNLWAFHKLKRNVYNQIIISMAIVDALVAIAAMFGNSAVSTKDDFVLPGERGNDATCRAQGWFFQFGSISSLLLNASLSTYFLVVIVYNYQPSTLKRIVKYLIGIPIVVGLTLAFAALPFYTNALLGCHLSPPAGEAERLATMGILPDSWGPILGFFLIPAWSVVAFTTWALCRTYYHISRVYRKGNRWRISTNTKAHGRSLKYGQAITDSKRPQNQPNSSITSAGSSNAQQGVRSSINCRAETATARRVNRIQDEVFWQCASYLLSLYLAWFTYLVVIVSFGKYIIGYRELWLFITFLYPLQPFLNCLVYFRPRASRYMHRYKEKWMNKIYELKGRNPSGDGGATTTSSGGRQRRQRTNSEDMDAIAFQQRCMEPAADLVELKHSETNTIVGEMFDVEEAAEGREDEGNDNSGGGNEDEGNSDFEDDNGLVVEAAKVEVERSETEEGKKYRSLSETIRYK